ncbi:MAG: hypothetical protein LBD50_03220 [Rickettsiales bacterium]|nr:hypothetical protein [Rickettsiales bacterium]
MHKTNADLLSAFVFPLYGRLTIFSLIFLFALHSLPAFAAGYECPAYKKYTSCAAGYYMTQNSSNTACYTTAVAGNACRPCSAYGANYTCAGGTACPAVSCTSDCTYNSTQTVSCGTVANGSYNGTQTCNAIKNSVSGCYTWGATSGCTITCNTGYSLTSTNICAQICTAGITKLRTSSLTTQLYNTKVTTPALGIKYNNQICYGSLTSGSAINAFNINYSSGTYHTVK